MITYSSALLFISLLWLFARGAVIYKNRALDFKRELQLLLVYICIIVVLRFTFFPFGKVDGQIQPLIFTGGRPLRINLIPFVNLLDYSVFKEAMLNLIGNVTMFMPLGIVWPSVFKKLETHGQVIFAGVGTSLLIEILQLPFDRVTDVDDLIMNSAGFLVGYGIYLLFKRKKK